MKKVTNGKVALSKIKEGVDLVADAVKVTLGPNGKNAAMYRAGTSPLITKDGVTVAKEIIISDPEVGIGVEAVKAAAEKTVQQSGDGTTTTCVLAQALYNEGLKRIELGESSRHVASSILENAETISQKIINQSVDVKGDDDVYHVAYVSSNGDGDIATMVTSAFSSVGMDGVVLLDETDMPHSYLDITDGLKLNRGFYSPYYVNNVNGTCVYEDVRVLVFADEVAMTEHFTQYVIECSKNNVPLLIIAKSIDAKASSALIANKIQSGLKIVHVTPPSRFEYQNDILEDIAAYCGCEVVSLNSGVTPMSKVAEGRANKIVVSDKETLIMGGHSNKEKVLERLSVVTEKVKSAKYPFEKDILILRSGILSGKVARILVGGKTDVEKKERKDRIEDSIEAAKAAIEMGVVDGGGMSLYYAAEGEYAECFKEPFRQIIKNGSKSYEVVESKLDGKGYDSINDEYVDLKEKGIIDPTKVVVSCVTNAASTAALLLTTGVLITEEG